MTGEEFERSIAEHDRRMVEHDQIHQRIDAKLEFVVQTLANVTTAIHDLAAAANEDGKNIRALADIARRREGRIRRLENGEHDQ